MYKTNQLRQFSLFVRRANEIRLLSHFLEDSLRRIHPVGAPVSVVVTMHGDPSVLAISQVHGPRNGPRHVTIGVSQRPTGRTGRNIGH